MTTIGTTVLLERTGWKTKRPGGKSKYRNKQPANPFAVVSHGSCRAIPIDIRNPVEATVI